MTEIEEGTVALQVRLNGVTYALGLDLTDFQTAGALDKGLSVLNSCLHQTLRKHDYFLSPKNVEG